MNIGSESSKKVQFERKTRSGYKNYNFMLWNFLKKSVRELE